MNKFTFELISSKFWWKIIHYHYHCFHIYLIKLMKILIPSSICVLCKFCERCNARTVWNFMKQHIFMDININYWYLDFCVHCLKCWHVFRNIRDDYVSAFMVSNFTNLIYKVAIMKHYTDCIFRFSLPSKWLWYAINNIDESLFYCLKMQQFFYLGLSVIKKM